MGKIKQLEVILRELLSDLQHYNFMKNKTEEEINNIIKELEELKKQ